jgi:hypothetical protein
MTLSLTPHNHASNAYLKSRFKETAQSVEKSAPKNMADSDEKLEKAALLKVRHLSFLCIFDRGLPWPTIYRAILSTP